MSEAASAGNYLTFSLDGEDASAGEQPGSLAHDLGAAGHLRLRERDLGSHDARDVVGGVGDELAHQVKNALDARELIKLRVLDSSGVSAREAADELAAATGAEVVQVIGTRFVLFLKKKKDSQYKDLL